MLNNLVHNLEVEEEQKMEFFGTELNRPIELDEYGGLAEGSTSLLTSLIMLRQYVKNDEDVREYLGQSMKKNESEKLKGTLREKYLTYFPSLGDEI